MFVAPTQNQVSSRPALPDDFEVVRAGKKFEALLGSYAAASRAWARELTQRHAATDAKFPDKDFSSPEQAQFFTSCRATEMDAVSTALEKITAKMERLAASIRELPIRTPEGLRARVLVNIWDNRPYIASHVDFTFDDETNYEMLFHTVVSFCGLSKVADHFLSNCRVPQE